jgi:hypothetical protein
MLDAGIAPPVDGVIVTAGVAVADAVPLVFAE